MDQILFFVAPDFKLSKCQFSFHNLVDLCIKIGRKLGVKLFFRTHPTITLFFSQNRVRMHVTALTGEEANARTCRNFARIPRVFCGKSARVPRLLKLRRR